MRAKFKFSNYLYPFAIKEVQLLWFATIILLSVMIYKWYIASDSALDSQKIFVDQLLLSKTDFELGNNSALIKLSLNQIGESEKTASSVKDLRNNVYKNILKEKLSRIKENNDFAIKPLPK